MICQKIVIEVAFELPYNALKILKKNAVSGLAVAQWLPTSYILPPIANGGPLGSCYLGIFVLFWNLQVHLHTFGDTECTLFYS